MQKYSRQIVQEQKLKLEPHLISIVFRLPVDCFCGCGTDRNTQNMKTWKKKLRKTSARQPYVKQQANKLIRTLQGTAFVAWHAKNYTMQTHQTWRIAI